MPFGSAAQAGMLITRCPECATAFRVSREQLEARNGRVRCGRCSEIFDALAALESEAPAKPAAEQTPSEEAAPVYSVPVPIETFAALAREAVDDIAMSPLPTATAESRHVEDFTPAALQVHPAACSTQPGDYAPDDTSYEEQFGHGRARRGRLGWWIASGVLLLALLAQGLFFFRGALALVAPETKPYIYALCAELGCDVPLPRRAELMSIETSDLQGDPAHPGVMVLSATLRNRAAFPQDYPALELTLTNEADQPLARRVLQPRDYLRREPVDGMSASSEEQVRLHIEAAALKAKGYRLYLFYP